MTRRVTGNSKAGRQLRAQHATPRDDKSVLQSPETAEWNRIVEAKNAARIARRNKERQGD